MLSIEQISARVENLRQRAAERDSRQQDVLAVRKGQIATVYPDFFPEGVDANVVANFIDIVAKDLSEVMAPLPSVNCSAANQANDRARRFADTRTRIATNYFAHSDLQVQMYIFSVMTNISFPFLRAFVPKNTFYTTFTIFISTFSIFTILFGKLLLNFLYNY